MKTGNSIHTQNSSRINPKTTAGYYIHFFILNATMTILVSHKFTHIFYVFTYIFSIFTHISYEKPLDLTYKLTYTMSILFFR